jgi:hypothetical protein
MGLDGRKGRSIIRLRVLCQDRRIKRKNQKQGEKKTGHGGPQVDGAFILK